MAFARVLFVFVVWTALFRVGSVRLSTTNQGRSRGEGRNILIVEDNNASATDWNAKNVELSLNRREQINKGGLIATQVRGKDVPQQLATGKYDIVLVPGGHGSKFEILESKGIEAIQQFVANGGGYMGICAGAYLACNPLPVKGWNRLENAKKTPGLQFFGTDWRKPDRKTLEKQARPIEVTSASKSSLTSTKSDTVIGGRYGGGPVFESVSQYYPEIKVVARYKGTIGTTECGSKPAVLHKPGNDTRGDIVVIGPHFESSDCKFPDGEQFLYDIATRMGIHRHAGRRSGGNSGRASGGNSARTSEGNSGRPSGGNSARPAGSSSSRPSGGKPAPSGGKSGTSGGKSTPSGGKSAPSGGKSAPSGGKSDCSCNSGGHCGGLLCKEGELRTGVRAIRNALGFD